MARGNARGWGSTSSSCEADLLEGVPGPFDAVLANLPYVAEGAALPPEIAHYEPALALFGGADGLDLIRRLLTMVERVPLVALEVGLAGEAVGAAGRRCGISVRSRSCRDLAGHERVVVGRR